MSFLMNGDFFCKSFISQVESIIKRRNFGSKFDGTRVKKWNNSMKEIRLDIISKNFICTFKKLQMQFNYPKFTKFS